MSEPLQTKVTTPLRENVQIVPKVSIFCVATIFFSTALTLLGMEFTRASQVQLYWNSLPLLHDDITELVNVRDLALSLLVFSKLFAGFLVHHL